MSTAGISGAAKAFISESLDSASAKTGIDGKVLVLIVVVALYLVYAWRAKKWPFKK